ncbi:hypothetical protein OG713_34850 [Streptomyces sp. NBC_00723]|uniref:hypothetical protein n=1 Tax=Streptomyces sp. NBC_00723 TaxID=2903673 RepID=UPI00386EDC52
MAAFTDDFNRADSSTLGAGWVEVSGDWSIVSSRLSSGSAGGTIILRAAGAMATNDHYAQVTISTTAVASHGVWCRGNANITSGYLWRNDGASWNLFSVVGGSFTSIGSFAGAAVNGDVAKVQAVGSTIKGFVNGIQRVSVTDTNVPTGTSVGLRAESVSALRFDDFDAADVTSGVTGDSALSGTATLSAAGARGASGASVLAATATLTTTGVRATTGAAGLAATAGLTADGTRGASGTASLAASAALATDGAVGTSSSAGLSVTANVTASGQRTAAADAALAADAGLSATGERGAASAAGLAASVALNAQGQTGRNGDSALTATAALAAAGATASTGTTALAATATLTAAGTMSGSGDDVELTVGAPYSLWAAGQPCASAWTVQAPHASDWEVGAPC